MVTTTQDTKGIGGKQPRRIHTTNRRQTAIQGTKRAGDKQPHKIPKEQ